MRGAGPALFQSPRIGHGAPPVTGAQPGASTETPAADSTDTPPAASTEMPTVDSTNSPSANSTVVPATSEALTSAATTTIFVTVTSRDTCLRGTSSTAAVAPRPECTVHPTIAQTNAIPFTAFKNASAISTAAMNHNTSVPELNQSSTKLNLTFPDANCSKSSLNDNIGLQNHALNAVPRFGSGYPNFRVSGSGVPMMNNGTSAGAWPVASTGWLLRPSVAPSKVPLVSNAAHNVILPTLGLLLVLLGAIL